MIIYAKNQVMSISDVVTGNRSKQTKVCHFNNMGRLEYGTMIRFLSLEGKGTPNIYKQLSNLYGKLALCYATVTYWVYEFGRGSEGIKDKHRPDHQIAQIYDENVKKVYQMVPEN